MHRKMKNIQELKIKSLLGHLCLFFFITSMISCHLNEKQSSGEELVSDKSVIQLMAQEWPGQEPKQFDMPVLSGLDKLEFGATENFAIEDQDLVLGITIDGENLAIPLSYMEGFEVANVSLNDQSYLMTWCGLVGSARLFETEVNGKNLDFDFGRALIKNNLLMVDRETQSVWNQLSNQAIHGSLKGEKLEALPTVQTTWKFWKEKHPETKLMINHDTSGAVFPSLVFEKPYYTDWQPSSGNYYMKDSHQIGNLGLGVEWMDSVLFFPLYNLFEKESPIEYTISDHSMSIYFDEAGMTAWAEDKDGHPIASTLAYDWAWKSFYPNSKIYTNN